MDEKNLSLENRVVKYLLEGKPINKKHLQIAGVEEVLREVCDGEQIPCFQDVDSLRRFLLEEKDCVNKDNLKNVLLKLFPEIKKDKLSVKITDRTERVDILFLLSDFGNEQAVLNESSIEENISVVNEIGELPNDDVLKKIYDEAKKIYLGEDQVDCNSEMQVYNGFGITKHDNFYFILKDKAPKDISNLCAVLVKPTTAGKIGAVGRIICEKNKLYFVADKKRIKKDIISCRNLQSEFIFFPKSAEEFLRGKDIKFSGNIYIVKSEIEFYDEPENAEQVLCIDFGTSNTTAGTYFYENKPDDQIQLVEFFDISTGEYHKMLPTIVCVDRIINDKPSFLYGYDAEKRLVDKNFMPKGSVFREIKRWMGNLDETVGRIYDEEDNYLDGMKKEDVINGYIDYVICQAEEYFKLKFKTIHFTAPVRTQKNFLDSFEGMLSERGYKVQTEPCVNEAIAVIYGKLRDKIQEEIKDKKYHQEKRGITVIDCGGGTTDVAHCTYLCRYRDMGEEGRSELAANELEVTTNFEGGNSNYAGNNITYRILQLLKIKIAREISKHEKVTAAELFDFNNLETILTEIDNKEKNPKVLELIYGKFEKEYESAESVLPTKFGVKGVSRGDKEKRKRNYFFLWETAENLKHQFFKTDKCTYNFSDEGDVKLCVDDSADCELWVKNNDFDELVKDMQPLKNVEFTIREIERVISGDIYNLLVDIWPNGVLSAENEKFYLSGQSCRISLFNYLLKEFVPGKQLREPVGEKHSSQESDTERNLQLKLGCVCGSIKYMMDVEKGVFKPTIINTTPKFNYIIRASVDGVEKDVLKNSITGTETIDTNILILPDTATRVEFKVYGKNGIAMDFPIQYKWEKGKIDGVNPSEKISSDYIVKSFIMEDTYGDYEKSLDNVISSIKNAPPCSRILVVVPSKTGYGFNVCQFAKKLGSNQDGNECHTYNYCGRQYFPYEIEREKFFEGDR